MAEFIDMVDKDDNVIGRDTRKNVHSSTSWHRGVHILVFNSRDELILQVRDSKRDKYPGVYDISVSGHVESGETFDEAMKREAEDEMGISEPRPEKIAKIRMNYGDVNDNMVSVIYKLQYDGKVSFGKDEITAIEFVHVEELKKLVMESPGKFAPFACEILKWHFGMDSKVEVIEKTTEKK